MNNLRYFDDPGVPIFATHGVNDKLPKELMDFMLDIVFHQANVLRILGEDVEYFQCLEIEYKTNGFEVILPENGIYERHSYFLPYTGDKRYSGKVYIIESWNGKTVDVELDDHYITILLPEEY